MMSAGQGEDAERFAAALEQGTPPGHGVDDDLARDLEIVAMLRSSTAAYAPHPDVKARAKQRLMAALAEQNVGTPQQAAAAPVGAAELTAPMGRVTEAPVDDALTARIARVEAPAATEAPEAQPATRGTRRTGRHTMPSRPAGRPRGSRRSASTSASASASKGLGRRAGLVGSLALVVMVALAGAGVFVSRDALPGEALYPIKRAAEAAGLALTFDDEARARRHLELATTRLDEVEQLVARGDDTGLDAQVLRATIQDFDAAASEGSRTLLADEQAAETGGVGDLRAWAAEQVARLSLLRSELPAPATAEADSSIALLDRLMGRTQALETRSSCTEVTSGIVDDIGPLPAEGSCAPRPVDPEDEASGDSRRSGPDSTGDSEGADGTGTPGEADSTGTDPTGALPQLGPDGLPLSTVTGAPGDAATTPPGSTAPTQPGDSVSVPVPLPLVPPILLPPLMPGMPSITIG